MNQRTLGIAIQAIMLVVGIPGAQPSLSSGQARNASLVLRGGTIYAAPDAPPVRDGVVVKVI